MKFLLLTLVTLLVVSICSAGPINQGIKNWDARAAAIDKLTDSLVNQIQNNLSKEDPACFTCAGDQAPQKSCVDAYADLYSKPSLDFRVTLGYTDTQAHGVTAEDTLRRNVWVKKLLRPCPENVAGTCGFKRGDDINLFTKMVEGPDGKQHQVNLHIVSSSKEVDDSRNRLSTDQTKSSPDQEKQTAVAEDNFFNHLCSSDLSIYAGHARDSGGPSFSPSVLLADGVHTNEKAYSQRLNDKKMIGILKNCPRPPKLIGLFACQSSKWFADQVRAAVTDTKTGIAKSGVATTIGLTEVDVLFAQAYAMLDSVLASRCKEQFNNSLNSIKNILWTTGKGVQFDGFFDDPHPSFTQALDNPAVPEKFRTDFPITPESLIHPTNGLQVAPAKNSPPQRSDKAN